MQFENVDLRGRWTMAHDGEVPTIDRLLEDLQDTNLRNSELQREIETLQSALDAKVTICGDEQIVALKRENAELTRKLAEQQAYYRQLSNMLMGKLTAEEWAEAIMGFNSGEEELRKLLESKVPEGFELVKSSLLSAFPEINLSNYGDDEVRAINQWGIDVVTSAQPKEPKQ